MMELDRSITEKFDKVLQEVRDSQSELNLSELGLVKKFSWYQKEKIIEVYLDVHYDSSQCMACTAIDGFILDGISRDLKQALEREFPEWTIEIK